MWTRLSFQWSTPVAARSSDGSFVRSVWSSVSSDWSAPPEESSDPSSGSAAQPVAQWILPALFLAEDLRLDAALERMQRSGQRLAVVLGRDGREVGIVTLADILRTIFGEVRL